MPRIDIELTSTGADGTWTWRAAGAREPRGVLDGAILPSGANVGDQFKVEADYEVDGITIRSVVPPKEKPARDDLLELLPAERPFEPVIQQRARRERGERSDRGERGERGDRGRRSGPGERRDGGERGDRPPHDRRDRDDRVRSRDDHPSRGDRHERRERPAGDEQRRHRPHFTTPPEVPQRPKPKRLRPGHQHRAEVLATLPDEQRPIAELATQGMSAVRQRLKDDNARLRAEGKPEMPAASVLKLAEELLPRVRVADWLDRAEAAQRQLDGLDLRDLRSVVAAADDPVVARDESTRELAATLKAALITKQDQEQQLWLSDVEAALDVGRIIRALRLSSQPPKAGVPFPGVLAERLGQATTSALQPTDGPDRWAAVLEAAAFSPIRTHVAPTSVPEQVNDDLRGTVKRLAPLLPQIAILFGIEAAPGTPAPKPLRPTPRRRDGSAAETKSGARPARGPKGEPAAPRPRARDEASEAPAPEAAPAADDEATPERSAAPSESTAVTDAPTPADAPTETELERANAEKTAAEPAAADVSAAAPQPAAAEAPTEPSPEPAPAATEPTPTPEPHAEPVVSEPGAEEPAPAATEPTPGPEAEAAQPAPEAETDEPTPAPEPVPAPEAHAEPADATALGDISDRAPAPDGTSPARAPEPAPEPAPSDRAPERTESDS